MSASETTLSMNQSSSQPDISEHVSEDYYTGFYDNM